MKMSHDALQFRSGLYHVKTLLLLQGFRFTRAHGSKLGPHKPLRLWGLRASGIPGYGRILTQCPEWQSNPKLPGQEEGQEHGAGSQE